MKHPIVINSRGVIRQEYSLTVYASITWDTRFLRLPNDYKFIDGYVFDLK